MHFELHPGQKDEVARRPHRLQPDGPSHTHSLTHSPTYSPTHALVCTLLLPWQFLALIQAIEHHSRSDELGILAYQVYDELQDTNRVHLSSGHSGAVH